MSLGNRISTLRKQEKLTQKSLAAKLNIPHQNLSNYEREFRQPDYETLQKIADYFEVTIDYLLGRSEDPSGANSDKNFDPMEELKQFMVENNMQDIDFGFYDIKKWKKLSRQDVEEIKRHFRWVVQRAEEREIEDKD
ncbi:MULTISPECIES: helix-turn-helix domain-containing protein [Halobacillus]|uniref:helix-turn-helix domain-containing protein n=1 Tax=Halobacillus TaxID=45667 RepID=UPI0009A62745|nr:MULTISPECIES: helix-turn-helix transcriptional regulator [Halobacillus]